VPLPRLEERFLVLKAVARRHLAQDDLSCHIGSLTRPLLKGENSDSRYHENVRRPKTGVRC
jgi:hypothetical protein